MEVDTDTPDDGTDGDIDNSGMVIDNDGDEGEDPTEDEDAPPAGVPKQRRPHKRSRSAALNALQQSLSPANPSSLQSTPSSSPSKDVAERDKPDKSQHDSDEELDDSPSKKPKFSTPNSTPTASRVPLSTKHQTASCFYTCVFPGCPYHKDTKAPIGGNTAEADDPDGADLCDFIPFADVTDRSDSPIDCHSPESYKAKIDAMYHRKVFLDPTSTWRHIKKKHLPDKSVTTPEERETYKALNYDLILQTEQEIPYLATARAWASLIRQNKNEPMCFENVTLVNRALATRRTPAVLSYAFLMPYLIPWLNFRYDIAALLAFGFVSRWLWSLNLARFKSLAVATSARNCET